MLAAVIADQDVVAAELAADGVRMELGADQDLVASELSVETDADPDSVVAVISSDCGGGADSIVPVVGRADPMVLPRRVRQNCDRPKNKS